MNGCSSFGWLKFWGDDEEVEEPAELVSIKEEASFSKKWDKGLGALGLTGKFVPVINNDKIYFISSEGNLVALSTNKGRTLWSRKTGDQVSGALGFGFKRLHYGTIDGEIISIEEENGEEIWRNKTSSEVLSPPTTNGDIVAVQSSDGVISGFDFKTGEERWVHQSTVPRLSLRGTSTPFFEQGFLFTAFANGKVAMIYPDSGSVRLEIPVALNEGKSELERIKDIDGKSILVGELFFSASYQGNISAIDIRSGRLVWQEDISTTRDLTEARSRIIAVDKKDIVKAFGASSGVLIWQQEGLKLRSVSSPVTIDKGIVIGDFEGYIHLLDARDGSFIGRRKVSRQPIKEIVYQGKDLLALDESGRLISLIIQ